MAGLTKPHPEPKRDRVLADFEVRLLLRAIAEITLQFEALVLLLLLTGQRLREVAGMRWEEIDLQKREWIIPASRTKNKRKHLVPLSRQVMKILLALNPDRTATGLPFTTNGRMPISGFSKSKMALDAAITRLTRRAIEHWVIHDLRRTLATGCAELRVPIEHSEAVLNHVSGTKGGVAGVYHPHAYAAEKRVAVQRWADRVERIVGTFPAIGSRTGR